MCIKPQPNPLASARRCGFTLVEASVSMGLIGILVVALYGGMAYATVSMRLARENLRATEVMLEKMECIRLFTWEQLTNNPYVPTNFIAYYYDTGASNGVGQGILYRGSLTLSPFTQVNRNYSDDMRVVTLRLDWESSGIARTRTISTYCSHYGIQNYVIQ